MATTKTRTKTPATNDEAALATTNQKMIAAWAENDADAFAGIFTEDATMILPGDVHLTSRDEIRTFMEKAYAGPYAGIKVTGRPLSVRRLSNAVAVLTTVGGVLPAGAEELPTEREVRATWVLRKVGTEWLIFAYHNSPIKV